MTTHLKLPYHFSAEKLNHDLKFLEQKDWLPHFNTGGYEGSWKSIALYAPDGNVDNIQAMHDADAKILPTRALASCPYFQEVIDQFKTRILSARLLRLSVGAIILPHRDYRLGYEDGCFRIHIPIITNPDVQFILDGNRLDMQVGECWYTNVNFEHSVRNDGQWDRIHLVLDLERNSWSDELFFSLAPKESFDVDHEVSYSHEEMKSMLAELQLMEGAVVDGLIADLKLRIRKSE